MYESKGEFTKWNKLTKTNLDPVLSSTISFSRVLAVVAESPLGTHPSKLWTRNERSRCYSQCNGASYFVMMTLLKDISSFSWYCSGLNVHMDELYAHCSVLFLRVFENVISAVKKILLSGNSNLTSYALRSIEWWMIKSIILWLWWMRSLNSHTHTHYYPPNSYQH